MLEAKLVINYNPVLNKKYLWIHIKNKVFKLEITDDLYKELEKLERKEYLNRNDNKRIN